MRTRTVGERAFVPLTAEREAAWNHFAEQSPDAWFWHTTGWMDYTRELAAERFVENLSFVLCEGSEVLAICPLMLEAQPGVRSFSYAGEPVPAPAFRSDLGAAQRGKLLRRYMETLRLLAGEHAVDYVSVRIPALASSYLTTCAPLANPFLKYGFFDLAYLTQVIDLRESEEVLWDQVRKGHRSDIKVAGTQCSVGMWDQASITEEKFRAYQGLHRKDAGRVTRSQASFDLMLAWIRTGHAVLLEAHAGGTPLAFALLLVFGTGAYYGSSCKDPAARDVPASHLLQWEAMRWLRRRGVWFYEVGLQQVASQWFDTPGSKALGISRFKRGFGGRTIPLITGEYFFSSAHLEQTFARRVRHYVSVASAPGWSVG